MKLFSTMIRFLFALVISLSFSFNLYSNNSSSLSSPDLYSGVDHDLARQRKAKIDSLEYHISFKIPAESDSPVTGIELISFSYKPELDGEFLLDFKAGPDQVRSLDINGISISPAVKGDHIAFPDSILKAGHNEISVDFIAGNRALNRRDGFLYTLFVPDRARTCFPCFDQPDLKAAFNLQLDIPDNWVGVSNTSVVSEESTDNGRKVLTFKATEPLSTYLFAFAAGEFKREDFKCGDRSFGIYYRETDPARIAQLPDIAADVAASLQWLEEYTGITYPFAKYDLVIIPGFQFGGMEHTGATFYSDRRMFLPSNATPDDRLSRTSLIAHETTHMWFGDYLTMRWFNDVWTKEVFANYYAAAITRQLLPEFDHDLVWLRTYVGAAMHEDRTTGATSIRQTLGNLQDAGLVYNDIIYNKAPVMMTKLAEIMGKDCFRNAIREYLDSYGYGNASWDDLVEILTRHASSSASDFCESWVDRPGLPEISFSIVEDKLVCRQKDRRGSETIWPQRFKVMLYDGVLGQQNEVAFSSGSKEIRIPLGKEFKNLPSVKIIPNSDGRGYGIFTLSQKDAENIIDCLKTGEPALTPAGYTAQIMNLQENALAGNIDASYWALSMVAMSAKESDPILGAMFANYLSQLLPDIENTDSIEHDLFEIALNHKVSSSATQLLRTLYSAGKSTKVTDSLFSLWKNADSPLLSERDFTDMAYQLALRLPQHADSILSMQLARISNPDRRKEFEFIKRAVAPMASDRLDFFNDLLKAENRLVEPYVGKALALLCHNLRGDEAAIYIAPALRILPEIQATGDIFFPASWCRNLLAGQRSGKARKAVISFLDSNPDIKPMMKSKILIAAYRLLKN